MAILKSKLLKSIVAYENVITGAVNCKKKEIDCMDSLYAYFEDVSYTYKDNVGYMDEFHRSFDFIQAVDCDGVDEGRRSNPFKVIESYLR